MKLLNITRGVVAAAAMVGAASAMAGGPGYTFDSGSAQLTFQQSALDTLAVAGISVSATAPATYVAPKISLVPAADGVSWNSSYDITSMTAAGGFVLNSSTVPGAHVDLSNISLDLASKTVFVDAITQSWTNALGKSYTGQTFNHLALFTGTLSGQTNIKAGNSSISSSLNDLFLSSAAIPALGNALGVPTNIQTILFPTLNFGTTTLQGKFTPTPAVPEPSTTLLTVLGMAGVATVSRRKLAQRTQAA
jgi:hypothetical protein